jgi:hypothetical protein
VLDGSTYPSLKLVVPSSICIFLVLKKRNNLYLGFVTSSSG